MPVYRKRRKLKSTPILHVVMMTLISIEIRQLFLRPLALTTANAAGTTSLTCLPKHGGARDHK
jgi:hypothetical protein